MRGVLKALEAELPASDVALLVQLNDANEPGVALEMLVDGLVEAGNPVAVGVVAELDRLAREMGIDSHEIAGLRKLGE